jgi:hypothetical protein
MILQGVVEIAWLVCGLAAAILMIIVHQAVKWLLLAFFILGLVSTWIKNASKFAIIQRIKLFIVKLVFLLFGKIKRSSNSQSKRLAAAYLRWTYSVIEKIA